MIGPIAKWAIKQALMQTAKAVDAKIATDKKAQREAEIRLEEEREAADPAYRAYKNALREKAHAAAEEARIERENQERKEYNIRHTRKLLWRSSQGMYAICVWYRYLLPPDTYNSLAAYILASSWILVVLLYAVIDTVNVVDGSGDGLGCGIVMLIPLCWLGYILLDIGGK